MEHAEIKPVQPRESFALVEIIMSIGILAIVSLYVIEMFVLAGTVQNKAGDLDAACLLTQTALEDARAGRVWTGERFYGSDWSETDIREDDGFTMRAGLTGDSPGRYEVSVYKNSEYVFFTGIDPNAGEPVYSLAITLFETEGT